jgi:putative membrane protein
MVKKEVEDKRTQLAYKRTELAHERTIMAYIRTATTLVLFGIAFWAFAQYNYIFLYVGVAAITMGALLFIIALIRYFKHSKEIKKIEEYLGKYMKFH